MRKVLVLAVSALALAELAMAEPGRDKPMEGDQNFLTQAYEDAEDGRSFSYASEWGNGRAYDGTDTRRIYYPQDTIMQTPAPVQQVPAQPAPVQTAPVQAAPAPALRRQRPAAQPVSSMRPAPAPRVQQQPQVRRAATQPPARRGASKSPVSRPPQANAGECFARMKTPAQFRSVAKDVQVADAYERQRVQQAVFETSSKKVLVKEAHTKFVVRQPKFSMKSEQLVIKPAHDRLEVVPAQFKHVAETVQVSQPRLVWKRGAGLSGISKVDPRTGQTWCLVEEAGETRRLHKRVVSVPEQVRRVSVPAQTVMVQRQVVVDRGGVDQIQVPAQYRDYNVQKMVTPAQAQGYQVPAQLDQVSQKVLQTPEQFEWVSVLCDSNSGPEAISEIQRALKARGLYTGRIDGVFGPLTRRGLTAFQKQSGIRHLGYMTTDTVRALGVAL